MRRLVPLALLPAALVAAPSYAEDVCAGAVTVTACVHPEGAPGVDPDGDEFAYCVTVRVPPCVKIRVPLPAVTPGDGQDVVRLEGP